MASVRSTGILTARKLAGEVRLRPRRRTDLYHPHQGSIMADPQDPDRNGARDPAYEELCLRAEHAGWHLELHAKPSFHGPELTCLKVHHGKFSRGATVHDGNLRHATRRLLATLPTPPKAR